jgi:hypothetical protein
VRPRPLWDTALSGLLGLMLASALVAYLWWRRPPQAGVRG